MKKTLLLLALGMTLLLAGCGPKPIDFENLEETYTTVVSLPYRQFIGTNIKTPAKEMGNITFDEVNNCYISDKTMLEFTPYFLVNENDLIQIAGFKTIKKVDEDIVSYIVGLKNVMLSYYGSVKVDSSILKRVSSIKDLSMCKDGESYKEVWELNGFPVEYFVDFKDGTAYIKIQYNKESVIK